MSPVHSRCDGGGARALVPVRLHPANGKQGGAQLLKQALAASGVLDKDVGRTPLFVKRERVALEFGELDPTPPGVNQVVSWCGCGASLGPIDVANCDTGRVVIGLTGLESAVPRLNERVELWNFSIGSEPLFLEQVAATRDRILQILTRVAERPKTMLGCKSTRRGPRGRATTDRLPV